MWIGVNNVAVERQAKDLELHHGAGRQRRVKERANPGIGDVLEVTGGLDTVV